MTEKIKFNVIIPTRERADTLLYCLRTVVAQNYGDLNIIVSDNFSQDNTKEVVDSFADPRIKYINTGKRISMSHNWEFALNHVKDGWVTFLGDDDGLLPGALTRVAAIIQKTGCQAIRSKLCIYFWPNAPKANDKLIVPLTTKIELRNGHEWLGKLMRGNAVYSDLPCIYTGGFVVVSAIDSARGKGGAFFLSRNPDIYSAIALASTLDNYIMLNEPIAVGGVSSHSTGCSSSIGDNLTPVQKFFSEENIPYHNMIEGGEKAKSLPIAIYDSYLKSNHLHNDFLKVKIEDQLSLALSIATPQNHADLREWCRQIASENGVDIEVVDQKIKQFKKRSFRQWLQRKVNLTFRTLNISGKEFGIQDIYGAAILAKAVFLLETRYAHWKCEKIKNFFIKQLKKYGEDS
ncbi:MAG: glycosyltransferase family 2 protein [Desulfobacteraceae bacterium]|jgi:glycosyltransferase involved in cell wall biosynthesis|nr:glycosyltransferase family 2 protein [Desulfobacteraceae bacterium]